MEFEFKEVPVPKRAKKRIPSTSLPEAKAYKVRTPDNKEVQGTVIGFTAKGQQVWAYFHCGSVYGGHTSRQSAAEALVAA